MYFSSQSDKYSIIYPLMKIKFLRQHFQKGETFFIETIQRFKENIWGNSDYADRNMCAMLSWKICNSFDITHQAHIRGGWKIWISCHMCAYQENIMIFGFLKSMKLCRTMSTFAMNFLEAKFKPMKYLCDFSKFQHSRNMLDFTYKTWYLRKTVMLCF